MTHLPELLATAVGQHSYWITSRATGMVAFGLLSVSILCGLLVSSHLDHKHRLMLIHQVAGVTALLLTAIHGLVLIGDAYLDPSLIELLLPFANPYRPIWTGLGVLSFWLLVLLTVSFYLRHQIGPAVWLTFHRLIVIGWLLALLHTLGAGSDLATTAGRIYVWSQVAVVAGVLVARLLPRAKKQSAVKSLSSSS